MNEKDWKDDCINYNAGELLKYGFIDGEDLWNEFKNAINEFSYHFFTESFLESNKS
jgi:hypothetical protein